MKKIGHGKYQEVYLKDDLVYKYAKIGKERLEISNQIRKYYLELKQTGIAVPEMLELQFSELNLITVSEYCGKPLNKVLKDAKREFVLDVLKDIIKYSFMTFEKEVAFYPKLNQFTCRQDKICFIDFFPSRTKEDFLAYADEKRKSLSLIFFGLTQKILIPAREIISLRSELREDVLDLCQNIICKSEMKKMWPEFEFCLNFDKKDFGEFEEESKGFRQLKTKDGKIFMVLFPSKHFWTNRLYEFDKNCVNSIFDR